MALLGLANGALVHTLPGEIGRHYLLLACVSFHVQQQEKEEWRGEVLKRGAAAASSVLAMEP